MAPSAASGGIGALDVLTPEDGADLDQGVEEVVLADHRRGASALAKGGGDRRRWRAAGRRRCPAGRRREDEDALTGAHRGAPKGAAPVPAAGERWRTNSCEHVSIRGAVEQHACLAEGPPLGQRWPRR